LITNLLPGLRDLRTPLATGYLWLLALWLLFHKYMPTSVAAAKGPLRSLYELGDFVGKGAILAAATFIAYLLGSLLARPLAARLDVPSDETDENLFQDHEPKPGGWLHFTNAHLTVSALTQLISFVESRLHEVRDIIDSQLHRQILEARKVPAIQKENDPGSPILNLHSAYGSSIVADFELVGIQLQARNRNFWDTYDRKTAEMDFRYGIVWPLAAVIIIVSWQSSLFWLFLLIIPAWFYLLAWRISAEVEAILVQAIILGMVVPPIFENLDKAVQKRKESSGPQTNGKSPQAVNAEVEG
jgi:hypothetical protein